MAHRSETPTTVSDEEREAGAASLDAKEALGNSQQLSEFKLLRASTKGSLTRIKTLIFKKGSNLSIEELECRLGILEAYFKQSLAVQANIDKLCPEADKAVNAAAIAEVEDMYVLTKSKIMSSLTKKRPSAGDVSLNTTAVVVPRSRLQRQIKLPKFEGKYSEFPRFLAIFNKMVQHDETLDDCERFLILKESLGAKPLSAIADFDETEENYPKALERLQAIYDKKALMFEEHIAALFNIPKVTKGSSEHLRRVIDSVNAHFSAMLSLGNYQNVANALIIYLIMEKLDVESQVKWEEAVDYTKLSSWEECSEILTKRCQNLEAREAKCGRADIRQSAVKDAHRDYRPNQGAAKKQVQTSLAISKSSCDICHKGDHGIPNCPQFENMSARERYNTARQLRLCILCLKKGHMSRKCMEQKCFICKQPHHGMLHRFDSKESQVEMNNTASTSMETASTSNKTSLHTTLIVKEMPEVLLETAVVLVQDGLGLYHRARVILDSASQINLMCSSLAQKLRLKKTPCIINANGIGDISTQISKKAQATIKSRTNEFKVTLDFYILPEISGVKPSQYIDISQWQIPKNIELADPAFNEPTRVDILLGAEIFLDLLSIGQIKLNEDLPRLQKTIFGWVVSGLSTKGSTEMCNALSLLIDREPIDKTAELINVVEKFWFIEQLPLKSAFLTEEEATCERVFNEAIQRDVTGKFIVKIPFKDNVSELGESFHIAKRRFHALEHRLDKNPEMKRAYVRFMDEYLELGHMERVQECDLPSLKYFAPHQAVLRPESTSTKLRVVFDCSCKTSSGLSLNDVMMKGPVVQDDLLAIILRFRCFRFALTADVTKMYRQAWVTENDTKYQAILWRENKEEELRAYRLRTITYGTTSAPYLATRCLKRLSEEFAEAYPVGSNKVLRDFYMDDLICGADTDEGIFQIYNEVSVIMNSAHFTLRKWHSNNEKLLGQIPEKDREQPLRVNDCEIIKTLGIVWEPSADVFKYIWPNLDSDKAITKRVVLAELSTLFDPLGLINPIIVKAKIFMQDLWILKLNWDESLPMNLHSHWAEFRSKLKRVQDIKVERYILAAKDRVRVEMHGFADASIRAYGACIYVRSIDVDNGITVELWGAKSRVAPLKTKSLPRLELLAAELLSNLLIKMQDNFPVATDAIYLWSDSEIVLDWLSAHPSTWSMFVANRVASIQECTKTAIWRHVPTKSNPADIISRGAYAEELLRSNWFSGPSFLKQPCCDWPPNKRRTKAKEANEERRKVAVVLHVEKESDNTFLKWIESHSNYAEIRRKIAILICVIKRVKYVGNENNALSATVLEDALLRIVYCVQQHYFGTEIRSLKTKGGLATSSHLSNLNVFTEVRNGVELLRVGGRLLHSNLPYDAKHQILLPSESSFVQCYVRYLHLKFMHAGPQALMAIVRQRFWIIHARKVIRKVTGSCLQCFKCKPKLVKQLMGDLPAERVNVARPFSTTGVDFCGPVLTTYKLRGVRRSKSYIAVFICFTTKAVHLEVVSDLTSKAFLAALKRFVARRGLCHRLYCDNATNFVGARGELKDFQEMFVSQQTQKELSAYCSSHCIEFHHIPPRSPHFGGLWEAAVKSAKYHLTRTIGLSHLTYEELCTVTAEIEAILNSRPLTVLMNDPNGETVLTPAHFLIGEPLVGISEPVLEPKGISLTNRWLRLIEIQQHFWKRWSSEYLHELQRRAKWTRKQRNIAEGEVVLVAEDNLPPKQWLMGRVTKAIADSSGCVRVVDVQTRKGEIRRAVHKIAPIPKEQ